MYYLKSEWVVAQKHSNNKLGVWGFATDLNGEGEGPVVHRQLGDKAYLLFTQIILSGYNLDSWARERTPDQENYFNTHMIATFTCCRIAPPGDFWKCLEVAVMKFPDFKKHKFAGVLSQRAPSLFLHNHVLFCSTNQFLFLGHGLKLEASSDDASQDPKPSLKPSPNLTKKPKKKSSKSSKQPLAANVDCTADGAINLVDTSSAPAPSVPATLVTALGNLHTHLDGIFCSRDI